MISPQQDFARDTTASQKVDVTQPTVVGVHGRRVNFVPITLTDGLRNKKKLHVHLSSRTHHSAPDSGTPRRAVGDGTILVDVSTIGTVSSPPKPLPSHSTKHPDLPGLLRMGHFIYEHTKRLSSHHPSVSGPTAKGHPSDQDSGVPYLHGSGRHRRRRPEIRGTQ